MKKYFIILMFLMPSIYLCGQKSGISVTGGIGSYKMEDLKNYQDYLISLMPVEPKGLSYFPPFTNYRINLFKEESSGLKYGMAFGYSTTGAHANYTDYSGFLNIDQRVNAIQLGGSVGYRLLKLKKIEMGAYADIKVSYVKNLANIYVSPVFLYKSVKLKTIAPFFEAGTDFLYNFNIFSIGLETAYMLDPGFKFTEGKLIQIEPEDSILPPNDLRSQFTGFRIGIKALLWITDDLF